MGGLCRDFMTWVTLIPSHDMCEIVGRELISKPCDCNEFNFLEFNFNNSTSIIQESKFSFN